MTLTLLLGSGAPRLCFRQSSSPACLWDSHGVLVVIEWLVEAAWVTGWARLECNHPNAKSLPTGRSACFLRSARDWRSEVTSTLDDGQDWKSEEVEEVLVSRRMLSIQECQASPSRSVSIERSKMHRCKPLVGEPQAVEVLERVRCGSCLEKDRASGMQKEEVLHLPSIRFERPGKKTLSDWDVVIQGWDHLVPDRGCVQPWELD